MCTPPGAARINSCEPGYDALMEPPFRGILAKKAEPPSNHKTTADKPESRGIYKTTNQYLTKALMSSKTRKDGRSLTDGGKRYVTTKSHVKP